MLFIRDFEIKYLEFDILVGSGRKKNTFNSQKFLERYLLQTKIQTAFNCCLKGIYEHSKITFFQ